MGAAAALAQTAPHAAIAALRARFEAGIAECCPDARIHGAEAPRVPNTTNVAVPGVEAEGLLLCLGEAGVFCSAGSACNSTRTERALASAWLIVWRMRLNCGNTPIRFWTWWPTSWAST